jgi:PKD repeat protein
MNQSDSNRRVFFPRRNVQRRAKKSLFLESLEERSLLSGGLVAAYTFDEGSGSTAHDISGNGNTATIVGAGWVTNGKYGEALSFNGSSSYLNINDSTSLDLTNGMTVEAWVDPASVSGQEAVLVKEQPGGVVYGLYGSNASSDPSANLALAGGSSQSATGSSGLPLNSWSYLSATYNGSSLALYVNGNLVQTTSASGKITTSNGALQIGGYSGLGQYFNGLIDEVRIYNQALTQSQFQTDMNTPVSSTPPLVSAGPNVSSNVGSNITLAGAVSGGTAPYTYSWNFGDGSSSAGGNTASFNWTDTTTKGTWIGAYGAAGYNVIGNSSSYPSYATVTPSGQSTYVWDSRTSDVRGLQIPGTTSRIAATWYSKTSFSIDVNLTDGQVHPVTLYALDWDSNSRSEKIQVMNAATGAVLSTQTISSFHGGEYLTWNVSGHVTFKVTKLSSNNAVISGLFIGAAANPANGNTTLNPTHAYSNPGTYIATLTATDAAGHSASASATVTVAANATPPSVTGSTPSSNATGVPVSATPSATFNEGVQAGTISFSLTTSGGTSVPGTLSYNSTTNTETFTPNAPLAYATKYKATVSGAKSVTGVSMAASYSWSFTSDPLQPAVSSYTPSSGATGVSVSASPSATFNEAVQASTITFTLVSNAGTSVAGAVSYNTANHTATFKPNAALAYGTTYTATVSGARDTIGDPMNGSVIWSFSTSPATNPPTVNAGPPLTVNAGSSLSFSQATESGGTAPFTYSWSFGDGSNSSGSLNPSHTYANPGTDTATVTVTDANNLSGSRSVVVTVNDVAPTVSLNIPATGTAGTAASFAASATDISPAVQAAGYTYLWNFGDGTTGSGASPAHTYALDGIYTVTVTATDEYGSQGQASGTFKVYPAVSAGIDPTVNVGQTVNFMGTAGGSSSLTYQWNFGDGGTASGTLTPSYAFEQIGTYTTTLTVTDTVYGFSSSSSIPITVVDVAPTVTIVVPSSATVLAPVNFTASATSPSTYVQGAGFTYQWNFGDGSTGSGSGPAHTFALDGIYTVTVTATDVYGTQGQATGVIDILPSVSVAAVAPLNAGAAAAFLGTAVGSSSFTYSWNFGDNTTATGSLNPTHVYANPGSYTATLTATDSNNLSSSGSVVVTVNDVAPSVTLTAPAGADASKSVTFAATATDVSPAVQAAGFSYSWTFGDGTTGTGAGPSHTYASAGTYTVKVTATDEYGMTGSATGTITVSTPPTVSAGSALTVNAGSSLTFSQATESGGAAPLTYSWAFGDGTSSSGSLHPSHTYANPGSDTATVTVTDADNVSSSSSVAVTVNDVAPTVTLSGPSAGDVGIALTFTGTATSVSPAVQAAGFTYSWTFGDGTTGTGAGPSHSFASAGSYTVKVTATDEYGKTGTASGSIIVSTSPTVSAGSALTVNAGSSLTFSQATESGGVAPLTYSWAFGDGTSSSGSLHPSHTYANPGSDTATVTVTDANNVSSSSSVAVTVNDVAPSVTLSGPTKGDVGTSLTFTATATSISPAVQAAGFTYKWDFGDGVNAKGGGSSHAYGTAGSYTVTVTATDEYGKTGTASETITISTPPTVSAGSALTVNAGSSLTFSQATESGGVAPLTYSWAFGDGSNSSGSLNPSHTYANPGSDTATVTVTDGNNVSSSSSVTVTVNDVPPTVTATIPATGSVGAAVNFSASATDVSPAVVAAGFTYSWNFGDGGSGTGATPSHNFTAAGTYTVTATATDEYGKTGTASGTIVISSASGLTVSAGSSITSIVGSIVNFAGSVSGGTAPYTYSWNFGDIVPSGNTAAFVGTDTTTEGNWIGAYGAAGYNVIGDTSSFPSYATVTASGQTLYTYVSNTTSTPALQRPENPSSRVAACWYSTTSFTVNLSLTDGNMHSVSLYLLDFDNQGFQDKINVLNATTGAVLNTQTVGNFGNGEYLTWNVTGNIQFQVINPAGACAVISGIFLGNSSNTAVGTLTPSHAYNTPGNYTATLSATDSQGHSGTSTVAVSVQDVAPIITINYPSEALPNTPVSFSTTISNPTPIDQKAGFTYNWTFGDGSSATGANPSHSYAALGNYTITVTATDTFGVQGTASSTIAIVNPPTANAGSALTGNAGSAVSFSQATASGTGTLSYSWDFGDGTVAIGQLNPTHVYQAGGTYTAALTVIEGGGPSATSSITVTINNVAPTATLTVPASGTAGVPVSLSASATDPSPVDQIAAFTYNWNFGDGSTGTGLSPIHIYNTAGTYSVSVTATDENGLTSAKATASIVVSAASGGSTVNITTSWLQQQGSGPYVLTQANTTYVLNTNVTTSGTAFVDLASNVTLNLNGYTVTYGNSTPLTVTNGGFESGSGTNVPGWNITAAPTAALAPNTNYLFGNQVLRLTNFSTPQTITSATIPITLTNHTYEATITPGNNSVAYGTTLTISVIDSVTGKVLGTGSSANTQRGFSAIAAFTPTTTDAVELQVVVTPPSGTTTSVDLDAATLTVSYDYGILASGAYSGDMPGSGSAYQNLPASIQALYTADRIALLTAGNFTLENGSVVQGQGNGANSTPLFFEYLSGLTVNRVTTSDTGLDTTNLDGAVAGGNITISNSTLQDTIANVTDRMQGPATISLYNTNGNIQIEGNQVLGSPQVGIAVDITNGYTTQINDNSISQNAVVADAYAIAIVAASNFQVRGNSITPQSGEGIIVDGSRSTPSNNGAIQDNYVKVQEKPNRETGNSTFSRALRLRNDIDSEGPETNIDISGNTFIAFDGPGYAQDAYAAWISYANNNGAMNNANVNLHDNLIEAIANTTDPSYHAYALDLDEVDTGINMTIWNNVLASNDTSLGLGGYNDSNINGVTFIANTFSLSNAGPARTYVGIEAGADVTQINNVSILDTKLANGATMNVAWVGTGTKNFQIGTTLNLQVDNAQGVADPGANVQVFNSNGTLVYQGVTNSQGYLSGIPLILTTYTQAGPDPTAITTVTNSTFTVQVTYGNNTVKSVIANPSANEGLSDLLTD